jgi:phospholipid transport system substrate-binding protein
MPELLRKSLLLLAIAIAAPVTLAQDLAPDAMLRAITVEVIDQVRRDHERQAAEPAKIAALVETRILPLFDFAHMTRLAVAHSWHVATTEQQKRLTKEFKTLLVRTYSTALSNYRDEVIDAKHLRPAPVGSSATVRSEVKRPGNERMTLDYVMEKTPAGWRIYDVKVAGVCLVANYRDVFAEKVRDGGVDGLIQFLVDENAGGSSRFNSVRTSFWEKSRVMYAILQNIFRSSRQ